MSRKVENEREWPHRWCKPFLDALALKGIVGFAASCARVCVEIPYRLRRKSPEFAAAWKHAQRLAADRLEAIAWERATRADDPSDTLLIFLLKASRPLRFRDNAYQLAEMRRAVLLAEENARLLNEIRNGPSRISEVASVGHNGHNGTNGHTNGNGHSH